MLRFSRFLLLIFFFALLISHPFNAANNSITIGTQGFIQQQILSQMLGIYLQDKGYKVHYKMDLSSLTLRRTMTEGKVDIAWENPATVWFLKFAKAEILPPEEIYKKVKALDQKEGFLWLGSSQVEDRYVLVMEKKKVNKLRIKTISDFAAHLKESPKRIKLAMEDECFFRPDCYTNLKNIYDFSIPRSNIVTAASGIALSLLSKGEVDAVITLSTNPLIAKLELVELIDDEEAISSYQIGIVAREEIVHNSPDLKEWINKLMEKSPSTSKMAQLNLRVYNGESEEKIARQYLKEQRLINI